MADAARPLSRASHCAAAGRKKEIMSAINIFLALFNKYEHTHLYE
jgi:hypothetical protein